jgi:Endonuclease/Exonuclease/phosphatase family
MTSRTRTAGAIATATCVALLLPTSALAGGDIGGAADRGQHASDATHGDRQRDVRFATFNASLNRNEAGQLLTDLSTGDNEQARNAAETIQRTRPDVLLINEFDFYPDGEAAELFRDNYLSVGQNGAEPIDYPYYFVAPSNTGIPSGLDLDNNGSVGGPGDAYGFGVFEGQFGMVVFSKYPIATDEGRTFQDFLWQDMPGALLPDDPATPAPADWYSPVELEAFRLSSKSHWDLPIDIDRHRTVHFLVSHPTPPVFDGPEDRNGTRNFDEIRFWADYVAGGGTASYIYDDEGRYGGLRRGASFVIAGDQNSDPLDGDSIDGAIQQLLDHPRVNSKFAPASEGAVEATELQGGANETHLSPPQFDTADFADTAPGNLRADYVLPSRGLRVRDGEVFWPVQSDPLFRLTGVFPFPTSDHRLVWLDLKVPSKH